MKRRKKLHAHDEKNEAHVGDLVEIMATRPISKIKTWRLVRVLRRAHEGLREETAEPTAEKAATK
jgi:small subunit ribosomal protein S17